MPATNELLQEGRYRINQQIPLDGKGTVYEAYDTVRATNVVVKEIVVRLNRVTTMSQQETLRVAFANQAKILAEINHDSLLHVHDYFSEIGRQYLVMESIDGDDLAELLERNKSAFAISDVVDWADQLLDALNYLHTFQPPIIHKNVRPQHIKLNSSGRIKLLAFGLADGEDTRLSTTIKDEPSDAAMNYSPLELIWDGLDAASQKVISNSYDDRSERLLKQPADARSDIYSLGATLYHLVTGNVPVDPLERSIELLDGNPDPLTAPHTIDPRIPVELSDVLMRAVEIKRENRFDSAVIMRQVVRTAMVRVLEREDDDTREQREAAEDIRRAERMRDAKAVPQTHSAMDPEMEKKAQLALKADELRILAEQRAAEANRLLLEKEAAAKAEAGIRAKAEAEAVLLELQNELLEMDSQITDVAALEPAQKIDKSETVEDVPVEAHSSERETNHSTPDHLKVHEAEAAEVIAYEAAAEAVAPVEYSIPPASTRDADNDSDIELGGMFSEPAAKSSGGLGMAAIAGIAVVFLVVAVSGWFFLSSGKTETPAAAVTEPAVNTEAPIAETSQPETLPVENTQVPTSALSPDATEQQIETSVGQSPSAARPAAQPTAPKAKKPNEPAKPAEKKKAVTVEDLIGDN